MKIIVIGLGSMGKRRIRLLKKIDFSIQIIGVDKSADRCNTAEKEFGITTRQDLIAALDECKELGISVVWLQPGADKPSVVEKAHALDLHVIQDCVLVQLP